MKIKPILGINGYKSEDGTYPIYVRVNIGEKRKLIPIGAKIKKNQWDEKAGRVKIDMHVNAPTINGKIIDICSSIEKNSLNGRGIDHGDKDSFFWWFEDFLKVCKAKHGTYHTKKMTTCYRKIKAFKNQIRSHEINKNLVSDFEVHLIGLGHHVNYIGEILTRFKFIVDMMDEAGIIDHHKNPFNKYKIKFIKTVKKRLAIDEVLKLEGFKLNGDEALARDMYILSFYGGGVRFGDVCRLNKSNFIDGRLIYTMHKTTAMKNITLPVHIFKMMQGYGFEFPTKVDWKREDESIASRRSYLGEKLKKACVKAEIKEITWHTSRHSIADYAIKMKLSDQELQGILGHQRSATTQIYKKEFYQEETDQGISKLLRSLKNLPITKSSRKNKNND